jgi:hypothetical protein
MPYVFDRVPSGELRTFGFEVLARPYGVHYDWSWNVLQKPPFMQSPNYDHYADSSSIDAYMTVYDNNGPNVWISSPGQGTYSYTTTLWPGMWASKRGDWVSRVVIGLVSQRNSHPLLWK